MKARIYKCSVSLRLECAIQVDAYSSGQSHYQCVLSPFFIQLAVVTGRDGYVVFSKCDAFH